MDKCIFIIKIYIIMAVVLYAVYILIDRLFGMLGNDIWRIKKLNDKYIIQTRSSFSPFWDNYGLGDMCGMNFSLFKFDTIEDAKAFIEDETGEVHNHYKDRR